MIISVGLLAMISLAETNNLIFCSEQNSFIYNCAASSSLRAGMAAGLLLPFGLTNFERECQSDIE
jgi:hypothetical protein